MARARPTKGPVDELAVTIPAGAATVVHGDLAVPRAADGLVVFAHGSGSSRHSPRNRWVAEQLRAAGLGTLLMDLLTPHEERVDARTRHLRFDIGLLAGRLEAAARWLAIHPDVGGLPLGYLGASTGAAAALVAGARQPAGVVAIVSRGGRPDLAGPYLAAVRAPTLLVVGGRDDVVLELNQRAHDAMTADRRLEVVEGATHLFEEPGALGAVATLAAAWFRTHMQAPRTDPEAHEGNDHGP